MNKREKHYCTEKGSIFIFAVWSVFLLSILVFAVGISARTRINALKKIETRDVIKHLGDSALRSIIGFIADKGRENPDFLFPEIVRSSKELPYYISPEKNSDIADLTGYNYFLDIHGGVSYCDIRDEQSKINLNRTDFKAIKHILWKIGGVEPEEADELAYNIIDWRDLDNERPGLSVVNNEDLYYKLSGITYKPKNRNFDILEELLLVKGMSPGVYDRVKPYFTVYGDGQININTCSRVVLESLGLNSATAQKITKFRSGNRSGKSDFVVFVKNINNFIGQLNAVFKLDANEIETLTKLIKDKKVKTDSDIYQIKGLVEYFGEYSLLNCVVTRNGSIMLWQQRFTNI